jgi:hypothetical protein
MQKEKFFLGTFQNVSGTFIVSDPCYEIGKIFIQGQLENVQIGDWFAEIIKFVDDEDYEAIAEITVKHVSINEKDDKDINWNKCNFVVGVDSGQAGIFDKQYYNCEDYSSKHPECKNDFGESKWYYACCDITESDEQAGIIPHGVVTRSGYGDGAYECYSNINNDNKINAIKIIFVAD